MKSIVRSSISMLAVACALSGCVTSETELQVSETTRVASRMRAVAERPAAPANVSQVQVEPMAYVGAEAVRNYKGDPLPGRWQSENIRIARAVPADFQEVANVVTSTTGIPVAIDAGSPQTVSSVAGPAAAVTPGLVSPIPGVTPVDPFAAAVGSITQVSGAPTDLGITGTMKLSYQGKLEGFLDLVAANYNIGWEFSEGKIVFMRSVTRSFDVPALPLISQISFEMKGSGSSTGDGNRTESSQSATTKYRGDGFDLWEDLNLTIAKIIGSAGTFQISPQTSAVVVVAPPTVVSRVERYLADVNKQLSKQVALSVKVYSVSLDNRSEATSDLNVLLEDGAKYGLGYGAAGVFAPTAAALPGLNFRILDGDVEGEGLFRTLASKGDVSVVTSAAATTLNGVPVPVQVVNTRGYVSNVEVTTNSDTVSTAITPSEVTTGFNLHLVPNIQKDGTTMLQYGMNISELVGAQNGFDTFSTNGTTVQLPNISQRNFIQQAMIPNGKTLVLAGYEQVRSADTRAGPAHSRLWPLGGGKSSNLRREIIVIAITPTVLDLRPSTRTFASR